jgi:hypothetical protein
LGSLDFNPVIKTNKGTIVTDAISLDNNAQIKQSIEKR